MGIRRSLQTSLIAGALVLVPAVVSIYVFVQLFLFLDRPLGTALHVLTGLRIPGIGFGALMVLMILAGMLTKNLVGRELIRFARRVITSVPILGTLYGVLEQTLGMVASGRGKGFRRVVLVEYPVGGVWALGLVAGEGGVEADALPSSLVRVFVPTSPNPTTGFVLLVPQERLRHCPLSVEEALKLIVSGGLVSPLCGTSQNTDVHAVTSQSPRVPDPIPPTPP